MIPLVAWRESEIAARRYGGMDASSTVIRGAWYQPDRRQLDLLFWSGRRYVYSGVPTGIANGFARSQSKGRFYNAEIRNRFPFRELTERKRA